VTVAWSGGGRRGLACAAMLPERCRAAVTLACPVPPDAEGLSQVAGMRPENAAEYAAARGTEALTANVEQQMAPLRSATDDHIVAALRGMFGPADQAALTGELADYTHLSAMQRPGRAGHRRASEPQYPGVAADCCSAGVMTRPGWPRWMRRTH
jgi:pimeloyl-ACP methyl ester carboxylesterase